MTERTIAVLLVLLIVVSGVAGYLVGTANPRTTTGPTTITATTTVISRSVGVSTTIGVTTVYRPLGIVLGLSGNLSLSVGQNETLLVSLTNVLPYSNNATFTGFPTFPNGPSFSAAGSDYFLPLPPSCGNTPNGYIPYGVVVYNQSGNPLQLNDVSPSFTSCLSSTNSGHVFSASQVLYESIAFGGFWQSPDANEPWVNATYHHFGPGSYTVVAFDPWSQLAVMAFTVKA